MHRPSPAVTRWSPMRRVTFLNRAPSIPVFNRGRLGGYTSSTATEYGAINEASGGAGHSYSHQQGGSAPASVSHGRTARGVTRREPAAWASDLQQQQLASGGQASSRRLPTGPNCQDYVFIQPGFALDSSWPGSLGFNLPVGDATTYPDGFCDITSFSLAGLHHPCANNLTISLTNNVTGATMVLLDASATSTSAACVPVHGDILFSQGTMQTWSDIAASYGSSWPAGQAVSITPANVTVDSSLSAGFLNLSPWTLSITDASGYISSVSAASKLVGWSIGFGANADQVEPKTVYTGSGGYFIDDGQTGASGTSQALFSDITVTTDDAPDATLGPLTAVVLHNISFTNASSLSIMLFKDGVSSGIQISLFDASCLDASSLDTGAGFLGSGSGYGNSYGFAAATDADAIPMASATTITDSNGETWIAPGWYQTCDLSGDYGSLLGAAAATWTLEIIASSNSGVTTTGSLECWQMQFGDKWFSSGGGCDMKYVAWAPPPPPTPAPLQYATSGDLISTMTSSSIIVPGPPSYGTITSPLASITIAGLHHPCYSKLTICLRKDAASICVLDGAGDAQGCVPIHGDFVFADGYAPINSANGAIYSPGYAPLMAGIPGSTKTPEVTISSLLAGVSANDGTWYLDVTDASGDATAVICTWGFSFGSVTQVSSTVFAIPGGILPDNGSASFTSGFNLVDSIAPQCLFNGIVLKDIVHSNMSALGISLSQGGTTLDAFLPGEVAPGIHLNGSYVLAPGHSYPAYSSITDGSSTLPSGYYSGDVPVGSSTMWEPLDYAMATGYWQLQISDSIDTSGTGASSVQAGLQCWFLVFTPGSIFYDDAAFQCGPPAVAASPSPSPSASSSSSASASTVPSVAASTVATTSAVPVASATGSDSPSSTPVITDTPSSTSTVAEVLASPSASPAVSDAASPSATSSASPSVTSSGSASASQSATVTAVPASATAAAASSSGTSSELPTATASVVPTTTTSTLPTSTSSLSPSVSSAAVAASSSASISTTFTATPSVTSASASSPTSTSSQQPSPTVSTTSTYTPMPSASSYPSSSSGTGGTSGIDWSNITMIPFSMFTLGQRASVIGSVYAASASTISTNFNPMPIARRLVPGPIRTLLNETINKGSAGLWDTITAAMLNVVWAYPPAMGGGGSSSSSGSAISDSNNSSSGGGSKMLGLGLDLTVLMGMPFDPYSYMYSASQSSSSGIYNGGSGTSTSGTCWQTQCNGTVCYNVTVACVISSTYSHDSSGSSSGGDGPSINYTGVLAQRMASSEDVILALDLWMLPSILLPSTPGYNGTVFGNASTAGSKKSMGNGRLPLQRGIPVYPGSSSSPASIFLPLGWGDTRGNVSQHYQVTSSLNVTGMFIDVSSVAFKLRGWPTEAARNASAAFGRVLQFNDSRPHVVEITAPTPSTTTSSSAAPTAQSPLSAVVPAGRLLPGFVYYVDVRATVTMRFATAEAPSTTLSSTSAAVASTSARTSNTTTSNGTTSTAGTTNTTSTSKRLLSTSAAASVPSWVYDTITTTVAMGNPALLYVHQPPYGGRVTSSPSNGSALTTSFALQSTAWTTDAGMEDAVAQIDMSSVALWAAASAPQAATTMAALYQILVGNHGSGSANSSTSTTSSSGTNTSTVQDPSAAMWASVYQLMNASASSCMMPLKALNATSAAALALDNSTSYSALMYSMMGLSSSSPATPQLLCAGIERGAESVVKSLRGGPSATLNGNATANDDRMRKNTAISFSFRVDSTAASIPSITAGNADILLSALQQASLRSSSSWPGTPLAATSTWSNMSSTTLPQGTGANNSLSLILIVTDGEGGVSASVIGATVSSPLSAAAASDAAAVSSFVANIATTVTTTSATTNPLGTLQTISALGTVFSGASTSTLLASNSTGSGAANVSASVAAEIAANNTAIKASLMTSLLTAVTTLGNGTAAAISGSSSSSSSTVPLDDGVLDTASNALTSLTADPREMSKASSALALDTVTTMLTFALVPSTISDDSAAPTTPGGTANASAPSQPTPSVPPFPVATGNTIINVLVNVIAADTLITSSAASTNGNSTTSATTTVAPAAATNVSAAVRAQLQSSLTVLSAALLRAARPGDAPVTVKAGPPSAFMTAISPITSNPNSTNTSGHNATNATVATVTVPSYCGSALTMSSARVTANGHGAASVPLAQPLAPCSLTGASTVQTVVMDPPSASMAGASLAAAAAAAGISSSSLDIRIVQYGVSPVSEATGWDAIKYQVPNSTTANTASARRLLSGSTSAQAAIASSGLTDPSTTTADLLPSRGLDSRVVSVDVQTPGGKRVPVSNAASPIHITVPLGDPATGSSATTTAKAYVSRTVNVTCPAANDASAVAGVFLPAIYYSAGSSINATRVRIVLVSNISYVTVQNGPEGKGSSSKVPFGASLQSAPAKVYGSQLVSVTSPVYQLQADCGSLIGTKTFICGPGTYGQTVSYNCPEVALTPSCAYWDTSLGKWSSAGCTVASVTATSVTCACTHLTEFGARFAALGEAQQEIFAETMELSDIRIFSWKPFIFIVIGSLTGLLLIGVIITSALDRIGARRFYWVLKTDDEIQWLQRVSQAAGQRFTLDRFLDRDQKLQQKLLLDDSDAEEGDGERAVSRNSAVLPAPATTPGRTPSIKNDSVSRSSISSPQRVHPQQQKKPSVRQAAYNRVVAAFGRFKASGPQAAGYTPVVFDGAATASSPYASSSSSSSSLHHLAQDAGSEDESDSLLPTADTWLCVRAWRLKGLVASIFLLRIWFDHTYISILTRFDAKVTRTNRLVALYALLMSSLCVTAFWYSFRNGNGEDDLPEMDFTELFVVAALSAAMQQPVDTIIGKLMSRAGEADFWWRYPSLSRELQRRSDAQARYAAMSKEQLQAEVELLATRANVVKMLPVNTNKGGVVAGLASGGTDPVTMIASPGHFARPSGNFDGHSVAWAVTDTLDHSYSDKPLGIHRAGAHVRQHRTSSSMTELPAQAATTASGSTKRSTIATTTTTTTMHSRRASQGLFAAHNGIVHYQPGVLMLSSEDDHASNGASSQGSFGQDHDPSSMGPSPCATESSVPGQMMLMDIGSPDHHNSHCGSEDDGFDDDPLMRTRGVSQTVSTTLIEGHLIPDRSRTSVALLSPVKENDCLSDAGSDVVTQVNSIIADAINEKVPPPASSSLDTTTVTMVVTSTGRRVASRSASNGGSNGGPTARTTDFTTSPTKGGNRQSEELKASSGGDDGGDDDNYDEEDGFEYNWIDAPPTCVSVCCCLLFACNRHPRQKAKYIARQRQLEAKAKAKAEAKRQAKLAAKRAAREKARIARGASGVSDRDGSGVYKSTSGIGTSKEDDRENQEEEDVNEGQEQSEEAEDAADKLSELLGGLGEAAPSLLADFIMKKLASCCSCGRESKNHETKKAGGEGADAHGPAPSAAAAEHSGCCASAPVCCSWTWAAVLAYSVVLSIVAFCLFYMLLFGLYQPEEVTISFLMAWAAGQASTVFIVQPVVMALLVVWSYIIHPSIVPYVIWIPYIGPIFASKEAKALASGNGGATLTGSLEHLTMLRAAGAASWVQPEAAVLAYGAAGAVSMAVSGIGKIRKNMRKSKMGAKGAEEEEKCGAWASLSEDTRRQLILARYVLAMEAQAAPAPVPAVQAGADPRPGSGSQRPGVASMSSITSGDHATIASLQSQHEVTIVEALHDQPSPPRSAYSHAPCLSSQRGFAAGSTAATTSGRYPPASVGGGSMSAAGAGVLGIHGHAGAHPPPTIDAWRP